MSLSLPNPTAVAMPKPSPVAEAPLSPQGQRPQAKLQEPTYLGQQVAAGPQQKGAGTLLGTTG